MVLVEQGLKPQALGAGGHGEFDPLLANDSEDHRAKNRRVEIELEPNITGCPRCRWRTRRLGRDCGRGGVARPGDFSPAQPRNR